MRRFFARQRTREPGWLAVSMQPGGLSFAHGVCASGKKCVVTRCGARTVEESPKDLERVAKALGMERYQCLTILPPSDYQLLQVDAPNVPPAEMKNAVRWRIKDMLDYQVERATIDVLDIPVEPAGSARGHSMYAVAAPNDVIRTCMERFTAAHIPLSVIDIAETAQRNIAALFETAGRGLAFLYVGPAHALLTVNFAGELYLARRIDVGMEQLLKLRGGGSEELLSRILLEVQRSFDHLDRQYPGLNIAKVLMGPEPGDTGLATYLAANLGIPVEQANLEEVIDFGHEAALEGDAAWRLFDVVGAALRNGTKTL
jgi:MSHA biogenesis protein MshI